MHEPIQDRIAGAIRFLDGTTGEKVASALKVEAPSSVLRRNRSGLYVIWSAPPGSMVATVSDPVSTYLPRTFSVQLPRDADPLHADLAGSIFQPVDVHLLPSPIAPVFPGWAVIRASVINGANSNPVPHALLRVLRTDNGNLLATGMSDDRGEALVPVPGVPVTTFDSGNGAVTATEIDAQIQTVVDPALTGVPDPDDLDARKNTLVSSKTDIKLASGRILEISLAVTLP